MAEVRLAKERGVAWVDEDVCPSVVASGPWYLHPKGYAARPVLRDGIRSTEKLHQFLMGYRDGYTVDHINGDGLDCRRSNMRWATKSQQQANQGLSRANTSGYRGVSWVPRKSKWLSRIKTNRVQVHLGYFMTPGDAARAYDRKALELFGEFARLNFPEEN